MSIYIEERDLLEHMFNACTTDQISEFRPEKRGFRLRGHSTTIRLERVFWNTLEGIALELGISLPELIERTLDGCIVANEKNLSSCLRVICMKYVAVYAK